MDLLETMRVEAGGAMPLLERHLARLSASARHFDYRCHTTDLRAAILREAIKQNEAVVFRLLLARDGSHELQVRPLPKGRITRLVIADTRVDSADPMLRHKTTARGVYDAARAGLPADTDAILVNERGEATETTIANIAVLRNGVDAPPVSCGLLPGVLRAQLLEEGKLVEGVLTLVPGETIRCFNAVRGEFEAVLSSHPFDTDEQGINRRIDAFWKWFAENADRVGAELEDPKCQEDVDARVASLNPGLSWEIGPGKADGWQLVKQRALLLVLHGLRIGTFFLRDHRRPGTTSFRFVVAERLRYKLTRPIGNSSCFVMKMVPMSYSSETLGPCRI
jgi:para-aminobenzoate synthetase/4-amino-4-deoxychorismate lyase